MLHRSLFSSGGVFSRQALPQQAPNLRHRKRGFGLGFVGAAPRRGPPHPPILSTRETGLKTQFLRSAYVPSDKPPRGGAGGASLHRRRCDSSSPGKVRFAPSKEAFENISGEDRRALGGEFFPEEKEQNPKETEAADSSHKVDPLLSHVQQEAGVDGPIHPPRPSTCPSTDHSDCGWHHRQLRPQHPLSKNYVCQ